MAPAPISRSAAMSAARTPRSATALLSRAPCEMSSDTTPMPMSAIRIANARAESG